jgi:hypothetical protein
MEAVMSFVAKLGTVLNDRRFWISVLTVGVLLGLLPATMNAEAKADELVAAVLAITQGLGILTVAAMQLYSWTKRPPSGKSFAQEKKLAEEVGDALLKAIQAEKKS